MAPLAACAPLPVRPTRTICLGTHLPAGAGGFVSRKGEPMRYVWLSFGVICVGLGGAGAVLPLLPATPFLLLAAWAFAKSSDRFHDWLMDHPTLGPPIVAWKTRRAISRNAKLLAMASLAASLAISILAGVSSTILAIQLAALVAVAGFILPRREA